MDVGGDSIPHGDCAIPAPLVGQASSVAQGESCPCVLVHFRAESGPPRGRGALGRLRPVSPRAVYSGSLALLPASINPHPHLPLQREDKCLLAPPSRPPHWFSPSARPPEWPCIVGRGALGPFSLILTSLQKRCFWEGLGLWQLHGWPWVGEGPPRAVREEMGVKRHPRCGLFEAGDGTAWGLCWGRGLFYV